MTMWRVARITRLPIAILSGFTRLEIKFREETTGEIQTRQTEYATSEVQDGVQLLDDINGEFGLVFMPNDFAPEA